MSKASLDLIDKINILKKKKSAIILAHNYQRPEIFEVADFIGDSLGLCQEAAKTDADLIIFCGVSFMAESAVILNPNKKVVLPVLDAGCAMADMIEIKDLQKLQNKFPNAATVAYVNTSAEVKSHSDICCTSSNAVKVVDSIDKDEIIFLPDKNLANYVQSILPHKKIIAWDGYCPIHHVIDAAYLTRKMKDFEGAELLVHPESKSEIIDMADHVTSTSGIINYAKKSKSSDFLVLTECGLINRLNNEVKGKNFYGVCNFCFDMKKITLESVLKSLNSEDYHITLDPKVIVKARKALENMFQLN